MRIYQIQTESDFKRSFHVMKELRPHLALEDYLRIYREAHQADGYQILALEDEGDIQALMGYRFLSDYVRGRHLYIDDLVTAENSRSKGLGAELLKQAEQIAKESGCSVLRLCTGVENHRGVEFYERNGWTKRAFAYTKKLP